MPDARLIDVAVPPDPAGVVVVLHGGASRQRESRVSPTQLSVLRVIPLASQIARAAAQRLVVLRLLNSRRGWDTEHTPTADVAWALQQVATRFGEELPVCLVGHSLGGRAALLSAERSQVKGVVALAPWVYPGVHDTPIVIIHGENDRIASPERSRQVARRLARRTPVAYVSVRRGTHAMLGRRSAFDGLAGNCAVWMLLEVTTGEVVARIAQGATWLEE